MTRWLWLAALAACLGGCSDQGDPTDGEPDGAISYAGDIQPIFSASCASNDCHGGPEPALGLSLVAGSSYANIVDQPSLQRPDLRLVLPGEPDSSYLYLKLVGTAGIDGARMPFGGTLPQASIDRIGDWIARGALPD